MRQFYFLAFALLSLSIGFGQTLSQGDLAIIGVGVDDENFLLVALNDIPSGESVFFTDEEWDGSTSFNSGEGFYEWITPSITAGTVVTVTTTSTTAGGTVSNITGSFALGNSGDGVYIYQTSTNVYNTGTYTILGFAGEDAGDSGSLTGTGLTIGTNAVYFGGDNGMYNGARTGGDKSYFLGLIYDNTNWVTSGSSQTYDTTNFTISAGSSDTSVQFVSTSTSVSEGGGTYNLDLEITNEDATNATTCEVALTTGDAADINSYTTQLVTFPAGSAANQSVTITITDDVVFEGDETLTFSIQNVSGGNNAAVGTNDTFDLTITENDPDPSITIAYQSFGTDGGDWSYTTDPATFNASGDVWDVVDNTFHTFGSIPSDGTQFFGVSDLESPSGTTSGEFGEIEFSSVDVSLYNNVSISFDYEVDGFDTDDDVEYEAFFDNVSQGRILLVDGFSNLNQDGTVTIAVPDTTSDVSLIVYVSQNGGDHGSFDNFIVKGIIPTVVYNGNTNSGFGGPVGGGNLSISADDTTVTCTFTKGAGDFNDTMVMYISTGASGRNVINGDVNDGADSNRRAISNTGSGDLVLPSGFEATHAIAINTGFGGIWSIPSSGSIGNNGLTFIDGVGNPSAATDASFVYSFDWTELGFSEPTSFNFLITYGNPNDSGTNMFSSDEAIGGIVTSGNPGLSAFSFSTYYEYSSGDIGGSATTISSNNWSNSATWANGNVPLSTDSVVIAHDVTVDMNASASSVIVNPANQLTINEGESLTLTGDLTNNGTVTLNSTSTTFSSLIVGGTATGSVDYNRFAAEVGPTGTNDLVAAPVSGQTFGSFATANPDLAASSTLRAFAPFNKVTATYTNYDTVADAAVTLDAGTGYRAGTNAGSNLTYSGTVNTSTVNIPIANSGPNYAPWNLIGNTFPSYLKVDDFITTNQSQMLTGFVGVYGYDGVASDGWTVYNLANSTGVTMTPGQGFYVASVSGGGSVDFTPVMRSIGTNDDFINGRVGNSTNNSAHAKLNLSYDTNVFGTDIYFIDGTTQDLDPGYDTGAFNNNAAGIFTALVQNSSDEELAIQSLPYSDLNDVVIPVGVKVNAGIQTTISLNNISTIPNGIFVYLEDTTENTWTLLNDQDYIFNSSTNLDGTGRFYIHFNANALSNSEYNFDNISIYTPDNNSIIIKGQLDDNTSFALFDMQGRLVLSKQLDNNLNTNTVFVNSISSGVYLVKLDNNNLSKTQKIIIK